jgi:membrane-bound lytic murein transglycosylase
MPSACKPRKRRSAAPENGVGHQAILILEAIACLKIDRAFAQAAVRGVVASLVGAILCFTASAESAEEPLKLADSQLEPVNWTELANWRTDDHLAAFAAYRTSCQALRKIPRTDDHGPIHGALRNVCRKAIDLQPKDSDTARTFFEQNFQPVRIARLGEGEGFLTGYFEPIVQGSRFPNPEFHIPLYRRPPDLVGAGHRPGSDAFPNKGARIGRRNENNQLVPYHDRGAIEAGVLDGQKLEICWLKDPFDVLAIQIEGSARVILEDGTPLRINYDSHNGYSYTSIGHVLIERNLIPSEEMSIQRIREWMAVHPDEAAMVAQDTGSAIVGPARADLYWGAGDDAGRIAGRIRHPGRFVMLLPRELDMIAAGKNMPLPVPKPNIPESEVKKRNDKGKVVTAP